MKLRNRIGESVINERTNEKMTIIEYRGANDIDVQFEDGKVLRHVRYELFKKKRLRGNRGNELATWHLGEIVISKLGQKMELIAYRSGLDIDVKFDDGTVVEHCQYFNFKRGLIKNPNHNYYDIVKQKNRIDNIGKETIDLVTGQKVKIIEYNDHKNIVVEFEDGRKVKSTIFKFRRGRITDLPKNEIGLKITNNKLEKYSDKYIGMTNINTEGYKMKIIAYRSARYIDVEFEDGTIRTDCQISAFKSGRICKRKYGLAKTKVFNTWHLNETNIQKSTGLKMTIIGYRNYKDIDVEFEDGTIVKGVWLASFKEGTLKHPKFRKHVGEILEDLSGNKFEIMHSYRGKLDVKLPNGKIRHNVSYAMLFPKVRIVDITKPYRRRKKEIKNGK